MVPSYFCVEKGTGLVGSQNGSPIHVPFATVSVESWQCLSFKLLLTPQLPNQIREAPFWPFFLLISLTLSGPLGTHSIE